MEKWPIGVFTSVDAGLGVYLAVVRELQIPTVHLHAPLRENRTPEMATQFAAKAEELGIEVTVVFGGFEGESYADIPTTACTVGLVPADTRLERVAEMKEISDFSKWLGCKTVALHIGFVPEDRNGDDYKQLIEITQGLLDYVKANGQTLNLETGQESTENLLKFIEDIGRDNLFINFDPANMILYGTGDPIEALKKVGHLVKSVHCKDAKWAAPEERGVSWGQEVALGDGDVDMETFLRTLNELGYTGPLTIEREIAHDRDQQKEDIGQAVELLSSLKNIVG